MRLSKKAWGEDTPAKNHGVKISKKDISLSISMGCLNASGHPFIMFRNKMLSDRKEKVRSTSLANFPEPRL